MGLFILPRVVWYVACLIHQAGAAASVAFEKHHLNYRGQTMRFIRFIFAIAICGFVIALIGDEHLRHDVFVNVESWIEEIREATQDDEYDSASSYDSYSSSSSADSFEQTFGGSSGYSEYSRHSGLSSITPDDIQGMVIDRMAGAVGHMARDIDDEVERWSDPNQFDENIDRYHDAGHEAFDMVREATRDFSERDSVRRAFDDIKSIFR